MKYADEKLDEEIKEVYKTIDEYRKLSQENPNKMYFLWIEPELANGYNEYRTYDPNLGYYTYPRKNNNLFIIKRKMKLIICDISEKTHVLDSVLAKYRYHNIDFYGSVYNVISEKGSLGNETIDVPITEKTENHTYDILSGKEIVDAKEIFKKDVDIENIIKISNVHPREIGNIKKYELDVSGIIAYDDNDYRPYIKYGDVIDYLNLKEIKSEIFPSNIRNLQESELESMNKDELYLAYNEIFARHGHDFKTPEYKHYFNLWNWYTPISNKTVSLEELNEIERYNAQLIKSKIDSIV